MMRKGLLASAGLLGCAGCGLPDDWVDIRMDSGMVCAEHADGTWVCPTDLGVDVAPPSDDYVSVAVGRGACDGFDGFGRGAGCGVRASDGAIECWGSLAGAAVPPGTFRDVVRPYADVCGIDAAGAVACVDACGATEDSHIRVPVESVDRWYGFFAALVDGDVYQYNTAWDDSFSQQGLLWTSGAGRVRSLNCGGDCSWIFNDGSMHVSMPYPIEDDDVISGESGSRYACAVDTEHALTCVAGQGRKPGESPEGEFTLVRLAEFSSCALRTNGKIVCWGDFEGFGTLRDIAEVWHP